MYAFQNREIWFEAQSRVYAPFLEGKESATIAVLEALYLLLVEVDMPLRDWLSLQEPMKTTKFHIGAAPYPVDQKIKALVAQLDELIQKETQKLLSERAATVVEDMRLLVDNLSSLELDKLVARMEPTLQKLLLLEPSANPYL